MGFTDEIRNLIKRGNIVYRLIFYNVLVFVILNLIFVFMRLFTPGLTLPEVRSFFSNNLLKYLMVPSLPRELLMRPWTIFTYMFTHFGFLHILFNMLILFWFGRIFLHYLTAKQLFSTYIMGGLAGAILYIIFFNTFPGLKIYLGSSMLGASASIMAIVVAISFYVPNFTVYMLFLGQVRLKYIALAFIVIDILMIASDNAGGNIAHLGGALYGLLFIYRYKKGKDISDWFNHLLDHLAGLFKRRPKLNVTYKKSVVDMKDDEYNKHKAEQQKEIDRILDKIARGGYESLTKKEKETLFKMSGPKK